MSRLERLINLTSELLNTTRPLTAEHLSQTIPGYPSEKASFRRQFERDKDSLRKLGLPIIVEPVPGGENDNVVGYRIAKDEYYLSNPNLAPDEISALNLASQLVQLSTGAARGAMWKLGGVQGNKDVLGGEVVSRSPEDIANDSNMETLFDSITKSVSAKFIYHDVVRTVRVRRFALKNGNWYCLAFDESKNDERTFRIDRIQGQVELDTPFEDLPTLANKNFEVAFMAPWELGESTPIEAVVKFDVGYAAIAGAKLPESGVVQSHLDGAVSYSFTVRNVSAFRTYVLSFLDHCEIISPPALINDLLSWIALPNEYDKVLTLETGERLSGQIANEETAKKVSKA